MVNVRVIGPAGDRDVFGRVDTGADDTLIPDHFAAALGVVHLTDPVPIIGIGGGATARFGAVDLEVSDGQTSYRWSAWVGFSSAPPPVYGIKGFLQFFRATFNGRQRYLDLVPHGHAPPPMFPAP
jgi:hypothetical protein